MNVESLLVHYYFQFYFIQFKNMLELMTEIIENVTFEI